MRNTVITGDRITLRSIQEADLPTLWNLIYGDPNPEWKLWDAPYFPLEREEYADYASNMKEWFHRWDAAESSPESQLVIEVDGEIIGTISYYWEHKPSKWLEMGIVIYKPMYWSSGYGTEALRLWISHLFASMPLARVGLTTWSGNERMVRTAEKLGMQMEGRMRKCRIYKDEYYDSIRMGLLREEWNGR
ncbi:N-acetyltransferase [Paenibacillus albiflavus]|uniref:N-acetyltransferase n=1 Tax=Paenibacillus albiflavus TaxID=2545760 RepID=A0A4V2WPQ4_9BACL|nr:GNAT family protein [Paenibacillus albiflavus]TCZ80242.1 N-acetyltransferase [Paenibacillus albiflavus]